MIALQLIQRAKDSLHGEDIFKSIQKKKNNDLMRK